MASWPRRAASVMVSCDVVIVIPFLAHRIRSPKYARLISMSSKARAASSAAATTTPTLNEAAVHPEQSFALGLGEARVVADAGVGIGLLTGGDIVSHSSGPTGLCQQLVGGQPERIRDGPQHRQRGLVQATLDLAEVGVGNPGQGCHLAQRQVGQLPLGSDERSQCP